MDRSNHRNPAEAAQTNGRATKTHCLKALTPTLSWRERGPEARSAFTLLEVILALSLAAVILGLVTMAIHVHLGVAAKSQAQVEEAQLARALLQRMAEDLRNAIPFRPSQGSSSASDSDATSSSATSSSSISSTDSATSTDADSMDTSTISTDSITGGGICGNSQSLFVETSRRPRPSRLTAMSMSDNSEPTGRSDIRTVTYCLGNPGASSLGEQSASSTTAQEGLYRREMDRAEFNWAIQRGETDALNLSTERLAPEVAELQFTYYDGTTAYDTWDSTVQGKLPDIVKIAIGIRRPTTQRTSQPVESTQDTSQLDIYDMLVNLPNSQVKVQASSQGSAGKSSDATKSDTSSTQPASNNGASGSTTGGATTGSDASRGSNR